MFPKDDPDQTRIYAALMKEATVEYFNLKRSARFTPHENCTLRNGCTLGEFAIWYLRQKSRTR